MVENLPYKESKVIDNGVEKFIRVFKETLHDQELTWHWDAEDRVISPVHDTDWRFQFDNELPKKLEGEIQIPEGVWHRLIKGSGDLKLMIQKIKK
jgi:hypothetical protein